MNFSMNIHTIIYIDTYVKRKSQKIDKIFMYVPLHKFKIAMFFIPRAGLTSVIDLKVKTEYPSFYSTINPEKHIRELWLFFDKNYKIFNTNDIPSDYKKIAFVRNPFIRVVSSYLLFLKHPDKQHHMKDNTSFYSFTKNKLRFLRRTNKHFKSMIKFVKNMKEDTTLYRFENYPEHTKNLFGDKILNLNNSTKNVNYKDFYIEETEKIIEILYPWDIGELGYNFENNNLPPLPSVKELKKKC